METAAEKGPHGTKAPMTTGAREAKPSWFARMMSRAMSRDMRAFVVPGEDMARACGLDLEAAGLLVSFTPRHARVLVLVGDLPWSLKRAAVVAYAQMPRPRAILAVGVGTTGDLSPLPEPDVSALAKQENLARGVWEVERLFIENVFRSGISDFDIGAVRTRRDYVCTMHSGVIREEPGPCPICCMDLVPRESVGEDTGHGDEQYEDTGDAGAETGAGTGGDHGPHEGHEDEGGMQHEGGKEHGGMDHGDMDFMSMIEMARDLPRSRDGLPMEWVEAPFGPLFPGLPGGLSLSLTLDGDAVAACRATSAVGVRNLEGQAVSARSFIEQMAGLDPLSPVAYRVLSLRALEDAVGAGGVGERELLARVGALERERVASHLGWLAVLGSLLGGSRLAARAGGLQLALLHVLEDADGEDAGLQAHEAGELAELRAQIGKFVNGTLRTPFLKRRLEGVGTLPEGTYASGPVARARGESDDARIGEEVYRGLGFEPVVREGGDALSRTRVRLEEIERGLDLALAAGSISLSEPSAVDDGLSGRGEATVETPRGTATLNVVLEDGAVSLFELRTPSTLHIRLAGRMADDQEVAEFLVGVASLDISPWGVVR